MALVGPAPVALLSFAAAASAGNPSYIDCQAFQAQAAADGIRAAFHGENALPLVNDADGEGPSAAVLVGPGVSSANAGAPYPGSTVLSAVSLVGAELQSNGGPGLDSSSYPLAASSQYPTRPTASAVGGALKATSSAGYSRASADGGATTSSATGSSSGSTSSVATAGCFGDGGTQASADTDNQVVSFAGGALRIGRIHSVASATALPSGTVKVSSSLDVGQVTVAGQTVDITPGGLSVGQQNDPLPPFDTSVLKSAGITLSYIHPENDPDGKGVTAAGLAVTITQGLDQAGIGTSPSTVTYTFGRAYARIDGSSGSPANSVAGSDQLGTAIPSPSGAPSPSAGASSGDGTEVGVVGASKFAPAPGTPSGSPTLSAVPPASGTAPVMQPSQQGTQIAGFDVPIPNWSSAYLALLTGAVIITGGWFVQSHMKRET